MTVSIDEIDALLPQTQCRECGYPGCKPYATAIIENNAALNLCPPGGVSVLQQLGALLQQDVSLYIAEFAQKTRPPQLAVIHEADCIGCTKCIQACPVDAIVGAAKVMHSIIQAECTGCGLCVDPCPVDCISMLPLETAAYNPATARNRFIARTIRLQQETLTLKKAQELKQQRAYIEAAIARNKLKKGLA